MHGRPTPATAQLALQLMRLRVYGEQASKVLSQLANHDLYKTTLQNTRCQSIQRRVVYSLSDSAQAISQHRGPPFYSLLIFRTMPLVPARSVSHKSQRGFPCSVLRPTSFEFTKGVTKIQWSTVEQNVSTPRGVLHDVVVSPVKSDAFEGASTVLGKM